MEKKRNRSLRAFLTSGKEESAGREGGIPRRLVERSVKGERLEEGAGKGPSSREGGGMSWWVGRG